MVGSSSSSIEGDRKFSGLIVRIFGAAELFVPNVDQQSSLGDLRKYINERFIIDGSKYQFANLDRNVVVNVSMEYKTKIKDTVSIVLKAHHTFPVIHVCEAIIDIVIENGNQRKSSQHNPVISCRNKSCFLVPHSKGDANATLSSLRKEFNSLPDRRRKDLILRHFFSSLR